MALIVPSGHAAGSDPGDLCSVFVNPKNGEARLVELCSTSFAEGTVMAHAELGGFSDDNFKNFSTECVEIFIYESWQPHFTVLDSTKSHQVLTNDLLVSEKSFSQRDGQRCNFLRGLNYCEKKKRLQ
jgi:hypothetical protein